MHRSMTTSSSLLPPGMWRLSQFSISTVACCFRVIGETPFIAPGPAIRPIASAMVNFRSLRISRSNSASASDRCLSLGSLMLIAFKRLEALRMGTGPLAGTAMRVLQPPWCRPSGQQVRGRFRQDGRLERV
jgi:hypothetical protein